MEAAGLQVLSVSAVHVRVRRHIGHAEVTEERGADSSRGDRKHNVRATTRKQRLEMATK